MHAVSSAALLQAYELALAEGEGALAKIIEEALPLEEGAAATHLAHYVRASVRRLEAESICGG